MNVSTDGKPVPPWYKQFWPWFLIILPATSVVAGLTMAVIAFNSADTLVNDNYYKDGLAINRQLAQDNEAVRLGLSATMTLDRVSGELLLDIHGDLPATESLKFLMLHPVDEHQDKMFTLSHVGLGRYRADIEQLPMQRYYLRLQSSSAGSWRLNGEMDFSRSDSTILKNNG